MILLFVMILTNQSVAKEGNYLRDTVLVGNQLKLIFKYKIDNVKYLNFKNKGFIKYIYDIKNGVLPKNKKISQYQYKGVKAFRMGQFNKRYLRVVIESSWVGKGTFFVKDKVLTIDLGDSVTLTTPIKKVYKKITRHSPIIILDAGHGGRDAGATYKGLKEKDLTLQMAKKLKQKLNNRGYRVFMTRKSDVYRSLRKRTQYANAKRGNLFISLHANAAPVHKPKKNYQGLTLYYLSSRNSRWLRSKKTAYKKMVSHWKIRRSKQLTQEVQREVLQQVRREYKLLNKGIKRKGYWVLLGTKMPSILVETGYMTHYKESKNLSNAYYQNLLVEGIANGVEAYFTGKIK